MVWGMPGSAVAAGVCSAVLPLEQIAPKVSRLFLGAAFMTPQDYEYLRKLLKTRSGLVLSAEKHYLVESRLLPVARKARTVQSHRPRRQAARRRTPSRSSSRWSRR